MVMDMLEKVNQVSELKSVRQLQIERGATGSVAGSLGQLLQERMNHREQGVQFSKHAAQRVQQRGIQVTENLLNSINEAVDKARAKGAKDVVIISSQGAFIVNVPNNTVITSMSCSEMRDNIFTNIDSAVLV